MNSSLNYKALSIQKELRHAGIRTSSDTRELEADAKITQALENIYPYILILGEKEAINDVVSVKTDSGDDLGLMRINEFIQRIKGELKIELES